MFTLKDTISEKGKDKADCFVSYMRFKSKEDCIRYAEFWTDNNIPNNWDGTKIKYDEGLIVECFIEIVEVK